MNMGTEWRLAWSEAHGTFDLTMSLGDRGHLSVLPPVLADGPRLSVYTDNEGRRFEISRNPDLATAMKAAARFGWDMGWLARGENSKAAFYLLPERGERGVDIQATPRPKCLSEEDATKCWT